MPTFKGFKVEVTNDRGEALQEHKVLRHSRSIPTIPGTCTTYIESKAGEAFRIAIDPFGVVRDEDAYPPAEIWESGYRDDHGSYRPGYSRPNPGVTHFLATLYLDGRPKAEKRVLIYVDPYHPSYTDVTIMKDRRYWDPGDEKLKQCGWVFKDIGIEHFLAQLTVSSEGGADGENEIDAEVLKKLEELMLDDTQDKAKPGCIEITLDKVKVTDEEGTYIPRALEDGLDAAAVSISEEVSHTVKRSEGRTANLDMSATYYHLVEKGRPPHASFKFFYRSADILKKLCGKEFPVQTAGVKRAGEVREVSGWKRAGDSWENPDGEAREEHGLKDGEESSENREGKLEHQDLVWRKPRLR